MLQTVCYWEGNISKQFEILFFLTVLFSIPLDKLPFQILRCSKKMEVTPTSINWWFRFRIWTKKFIKWPKQFTFRSFICEKLKSQVSTKRKWPFTTKRTKWVCTIYLLIDITDWKFWLKNILRQAPRIFLKYKKRYKIH